MEEKIDTIVALLEQLADNLASTNDRLAALEELVQDEIIDSITSVYNTQKRASDITGLKEKYGSMLGCHEEFYSTLTDKDMWEAIMDDIDELRKTTENLDDATIEMKIKELSSAIESRRSKIKEMDKPAEVAVEEKRDEPVEVEDSLKKIKDLRNRVGRGF